jgi:DNA invertase Pin-like site-specific DNA recombinase
MAGIAAVKAAGVTWGGRKHGTRITLTLEKEKLARKLRADGTNVIEIARTLRLSRKTIYTALKRQAS